MKINEVEDPAVVLAVPCEEDVPIIKEIINEGYFQVQPRYEQLENPPEEVTRQGSLCQELLAQLSKQGHGTGEAEPSGPVINAELTIRIN